MVPRGRHTSLFTRVRSVRASTESERLRRLGRSVNFVHFTRVKGSYLHVNVYAVGNVTWRWVSRLERPMALLVHSMSAKSPPSARGYYDKNVDSKEDITAQDIEKNLLYVF